MRLLVLRFGLLILALSAGSTWAELKHEPLPLEVAAAARALSTYVPIAYSPNGEWLSYTYSSDQGHGKSSSFWFTDTGVPLAGGQLGARVAISRVRDGATYVLGALESSSWGATWSPDGTQIGFYSDQGGRAGVWIWDAKTFKARRFEGVTPRPYFGFESIKWLKDGRHLLCKVLPKELTVQQANALIPSFDGSDRFPNVMGDGPSVYVLSSNSIVGRSKKINSRPDSGVQRDYANRSFSELAILDLTTGDATRLTKNTRPVWFDLSPDQLEIAYTSLNGWSEDTQQANYDLIIQNVETGEDRVIARSLQLSYGNEISWSPSGKSLAYISSSGQLYIVGSSRQFGAENITQEPRIASSTRTFEARQPTPAPVWNSNGKAVYAVSDGELWSVDAASLHVRKAGEIEGRRIIGIAHPTGLHEIEGVKQFIWVATEDSASRFSGLYRLNLNSQRFRQVLEEERDHVGVPVLSYSQSGSARIAFVATDQQRLPDIWAIDEGSKIPRQVTRLNQDVDQYQMGIARRLEWKTSNGANRAGTLLLPPDYRDGTRLPFVIWIYGGSYGSRYINSFGLDGSSPEFNMHVLATRGYGVLFPDAPVRTGSVAKDLIESTIPAVEAAVAQGYADSDRLAIMGQSYGSFCTLSIITQTDRFKAAIITGVVLHPDLFTDYLQMNADGSSPYTGFYERGQGNMGGTPWDYPTRYRENSPLFAFDKISTPVLMGQGTKDSVKDGQLVPSDSIYVALRRLGKTVEYRIYENEGHQITQPSNVVDFWNRRLEFLAEHLDIDTDTKGRVVVSREGLRNPQG